MYIITMHLVFLKYILKKKRFSTIDTFSLNVHICSVVGPDPRAMNFTIAVEGFMNINYYILHLGLFYYVAE